MQLTKSTAMGLTHAAVGGAAGMLLGVQGNREGRAGRMMTGLAHGAMVGRSIARGGGLGKAWSNGGMLRNHLIGASVGAAGSLLTGGAMGTGALMGGFAGQGVGAAGMWKSGGRSALKSHYKNAATAFAEPVRTISSKLLLPGIKDGMSTFRAIRGKAGFGSSLRTAANETYRDFGRRLTMESRLRGWIY